MSGPDLCDVCGLSLDAHEHETKRCPTAFSPAGEQRMAVLAREGPRVGYAELERIRRQLTHLPEIDDNLGEINDKVRELQARMDAGEQDLKQPEAYGKSLMEEEQPDQLKRNAALAVRLDELDPWKHRARHMRCSTCMWYVPKAPDTLNPSPELGRCRHNSPTLKGYPAVFPTDWCGDHKLDETKL